MRTALLELESPLVTRLVKRLPKANSSVAPSNIHGRTLRKVCAGVCINRMAPAMPPMMLVATSGIRTRREIFNVSSTRLRSPLLQPKVRACSWRWRRRQVRP